METEIVALDFETTGVDVMDDRIVTASITELTKDGTVIRNHEWLINPGIEIPDEAAEVHGITTEKAVAEGLDASEAILQILLTLWDTPDNTPLVIMNANYDISILHYEMLRHGYEMLFWQHLNIIDPRVLDLHFDKYRKGKRKLVNLAEHYGVPVDESKAHDSTYDNYLAANVAIKIVKKYGVKNSQLKQQAEWYREWATGFEKYLQKTDPGATVNRGWPLREEEGR